MPNLLRANGVRFFVWSNDHDPPHVRAEYAGRVARWFFRR
ncbi:MAG: DUF4160 domain-containing protein [Clostridia bacterium]|nr:DUF4160 domain-containing protein [Deltaproteobacteria bacterium]